MLFTLLVALLHEWIGNFSYAKYIYTHIGIYIYIYTFKKSNSGQQGVCAAKEPAPCQRQHFAEIKILRLQKLCQQNRAARNKCSANWKKCSKPKKPEKMLHSKRNQPEKLPWNCCLRFCWSPILCARFCNCIYLLFKFGASIFLLQHICIVFVVVGFCFFKKYTCRLLVYLIAIFVFEFFLQISF